MLLLNYLYQLHTVRIGIPWGFVEVFVVLFVVVISCFADMISVVFWVNSVVCVSEMPIVSSVYIQIKKFQFYIRFGCETPCVVSDCDVLLCFGCVMR